MEKWRVEKVLVLIVQREREGKEEEDRLHIWKTIAERRLGNPSQNQEEKSMMSWNPKKGSASERTCGQC